MALDTIYTYAAELTSKAVAFGDAAVSTNAPVDSVESFGMNSADPWETFSSSHQRGERISSIIADIVGDLGIFVELEGGINGIVHPSDIDWFAPGEIAIKSYALGDSIEAVILSHDVERQRISLGIKQLTRDPRRRPGDEPPPVEIEPNRPKPPKPLPETAKP